MTEKIGTIIAIHDFGTIWQIDVNLKKLPKKEIVKIKGDWRPIRDSLNDAFDISSPKFPYISQKKIYENAIGQRIAFIPDEIFGASSWSPLGEKEFSLTVSQSGKITKQKGWKFESTRHSLARKGIKTGRKKR